MDKFCSNCGKELNDEKYCPECGNEIKTEENLEKIDNVIIGIYNKSLTKRGEYRALIGIELL